MMPVARGLDVRNACSAHIREIARLQAENFDQAWSAEDIAAMLQVDGTLMLVVRADRMLAGYLICRVAADEAEVLSIAVSASHRRRGVGCVMIADLEHRLGRGDCRAMFLEVDATNVAAVAFYTSCGFSQVGTRPSYYRGADGLRRDALILRRNIDSRNVAAVSERH